jgi:hypothetical protein
MMKIEVRHLTSIAKSSDKVRRLLKICFQTYNKGLINAKMLWEFIAENKNIRFDYLSLFTLFLFEKLTDHILPLSKL